MGAQLQDILIVTLQGTRRREMVAHLEQHPPVRHQSPTFQHLAFLPAPTVRLPRRCCHPTRTARRDGPLRLRHVRIIIVSDVLQRSKKRMATQLPQPHPRYDPPQQITRARLRSRPHPSFSLWRTIYPNAPDRRGSLEIRIARQWFRTFCDLVLCRKAKSFSVNVAV
jgi:hypothetical protein